MSVSLSSSSISGVLGASLFASAEGKKNGLLSYGRILAIAGCVACGTGVLFTVWNQWRADRAKTRETGELFSSAKAVSEPYLFSSTWEDHCKDRSLAHEGFSSNSLTHGGLSSSTSKTALQERRFLAVLQARAVRRVVKYTKFELSVSDSDDDDSVDAEFMYACAKELAKTSKNEFIQAMKKHRMSMESLAVTKGGQDGVNDQEQAAMLSSILDAAAAYLEMSYEKEKWKEQVPFENENADVEEMLNIDDLKKRHEMSSNLKPSFPKEWSKWRADDYELELNEGYEMSGAGHSPAVLENEWSSCSDDDDEAWYDRNIYQKYMLEDSHSEGESTDAKKLAMIQGFDEISDEEDDDDSETSEAEAENERFDWRLIQLVEQLMTQWGVSSSDVLALKKEFEAQKEMSRARVTGVQGSFEPLQNSLDVKPLRSAAGKEKNHGKRSRKERVAHASAVISTVEQEEDEWEEIESDGLEM